MEFKEADKDDLAKVLSLAETMNSNLDAYLEEGRPAFVTALDTAENVYEDEFAPQEDVDNAWRNLLKAMADLRLKPDKSLLEELIRQAEALNEADYDAQSFSVMRAALAEAKRCLQTEVRQRRKSVRPWKHWKMQWKN